ncbi:hypothetical protein P3L10_030598 [Capsicum annuum]
MKSETERVERTRKEEIGSLCLKPLSASKDLEFEESGINRRHLSCGENTEGGKDQRYRYFSS